MTDAAQSAVSGSQDIVETCRQLEQEYGPLPTEWNRCLAEIERLRKIEEAATLVIDECGWPPHGHAKLFMAFDQNPAAPEWNWWNHKSPEREAYEALARVLGWDGSDDD